MKYVLWHIHPDTDSYCSAVVYAQYLNDTGVKAEAVVLGSPNKETAYIFDTIGVEYPRQISTLPEWSSIILVDHNEASQSISWRDTMIIEQVIDHHKIADFSTASPLMMRIEPVGCTCTILHELFIEAWYTPSAEMAALMVSAIISDTLYFRSPITTERDRDAVAMLSHHTSIEDNEAWSLALFTAKSDLGDTSAKEIVTMDYKTFDFSGTKMGIGVLETTHPEHALWRREELLKAIVEVKKEEWIDWLLLCIVDVLQGTNQALVVSDNELQLVKEVFASTTEHGVADLWARVSRKKQLAPDIDTWFHSRNNA